MGSKHLPCFHHTGRKNSLAKKGKGSPFLLACPGGKERLAASKIREALERGKAQCVRDESAYWEGTLYGMKLYWGLSTLAGDRGQAPFSVSRLLAT